uniref:AAA-ATPase-like domain-containing protein n=1 Tax=Ditylenchus dipsaci TaxID=166011 RepID=A0A915DLC3_9BILA
MALLAADHSYLRAVIDSNLEQQPRSVHWKLHENNLNDILNEKESFVESSLGFLAAILGAHFAQYTSKKVKILIDNYDTPILTAHTENADKKELNRIEMLFKDFINDALCHGRVVLAGKNQCKKIGPEARKTIENLAGIKKKTEEPQQAKFPNVVALHSHPIKPHRNLSPAISIKSQRRSKPNSTFGQFGRGYNVSDGHAGAKRSR